MGLLFITGMKGGREQLEIILWGTEVAWNGMNVRISGMKNSTP
jgi:hypothetical protein